tara:strand:+ start:60 stop:539 length:480 start_codon:yes stop_codon:yes gene_type:complete
MSSETELSMVTMFRDATKQSIILELRTQDDWDSFNTIDKDARDRTKDEVDGFERDRNARVAATSKKLIDEAGELNLEHPAPFGTDKFDRAAIERQAVTQVFNEHWSTLLGIKSDEADAYVALGDEIRARENTRGLARESFNQSTDRRMSIERRGPTRSQ